MVNNTFEDEELVRVGSCSLGLIVVVSLEMAPFGCGHLYCDRTLHHSQRTVVLLVSLWLVRIWCVWFILGSPTFTSTCLCATRDGRRSRRRR